MSSIPQDTISVRTADNVSLGYGVAGLGSRLVAQMVDNVFAGLLALVGVLGFLAVASVLVTSSQGSVFAAYGAGAFGLFVYFGYFLIAETVTGGRTPGKNTMGLRVIRIDGGGADFREILVRNVLRPIDDLLLVGIVIMFFHPLSRRLGDIAADTVVVRDRAALSLAAAASPPPVMLRTPDAGPPIDGIERLGTVEHDALRVFLARPGLSPELRHRLAVDIATRMHERLALGPHAPERQWPPELLLERVYLQLDQRLR